MTIAPSSASSSLRRLVPRVIPLLVIVAAVAIVYWPGTRAFWTRDDYMQLAFARLVGSPWPPFVHDHYFPAPGSIFRPLGFASFWLWQALFGTHYFAHACGDLALHAGVALALYRVMRAGAADRVLAMLCTLLFALHPVAIGTALWWSARFDLLAVLFGLVALGLSLEHSTRPRTTVLGVTLAMLLAALLSKETALAFVGATACVWLRAAWVDAPRRRRHLVAIAALVGAVVVFFAWRASVIGTVSSGLVGSEPLIDAFVRGISTWPGELVRFIAYVPSTRVIVAAGALVALVFITAFIVNVGNDDVSAIPSSSIDLVIAGACLVFIPAILQAPVAAMNAAPLALGMSAVEAAMQSRLYFTSGVGLALMLAAGLGRLASDRRVPRAPIVFALVLPIAAAAWTSREVASGFAAQTSASRALAENAAAAVERASTANGERCTIVVLGIVPPSEWNVYVSMDSIAKALAVDVDRVGRCVVRADYPTFFNLMHGATLPGDTTPFVPRIVDGKPVPWLRVGDMTSAYVDAPTTFDASAYAHTRFLRDDGGAFVDVTGEVLAGRAVVTVR